MYLNASRYCGGGWEHASKEDKELFSSALALMGLSREMVTTSVTLNAQVGYWRKANAIHAWFVQHVQGGRDECQSSYVSREKLQELKSVCVKVISGCKLVSGNVYAGTQFSAGGKKDLYEKGKVVKDPSIAIELLPSESGFFFGSTHYDEHYIADLKHTVEVIDRCLSLPDCWSFEYQASW